MPDDKVAVFGNHFNLRRLDMNDTTNAMHSATLFTRVIDEGLAVWADLDRGPTIRRTKERTRTFA